MKVSIPQQALAKGLSTVGRAVPQRSTLPVLTNVLVATEEGRLRLTATDLQLVVTVWLGANIEEEGATTVPARTLSDLVSQLSPERVDLEMAPGTSRMQLTCGANVANINTITADEFPIIPEPGENDATLAIPAEELRRMIKHVAFAAATDDSRPVLTGVLVEYIDGVLIMAAADGFRLAVKELRLDVNFPEFSLIIPASSLKELERVSADEDKDIYMILPPERGQVLFHMSNVDLATQVLEGTFPQYRQIIPEFVGTSAELDRHELLSACKRADIFAREAANTVRFHVEPHDGTAGTVTVRANAAERGDNEGVLAAHVDGEDVEAAFNVRYIIEGLNAMDGDRILLETIDARSPGVIKPLDENGLTYVVMPMQMGR